MEILCAGTLIRLVGLGCELHVATMTPGDKGSAVLSPEEISAIRRREAEQGAKAVGAVSYRCLEFRDLEITFDNTSRRRVAGLLRDIAPDMVFTTPPKDYMFDHEITAQLVRDACFNAGCKNYPAEGSSPPLPHVPYLYYSDSIGGHDLFGNPSPLHHMVDISEQIEQKSNALACHDSQRAWLKKQHGMDDYIESMRRWSALRGAEIGIPFAEGFLQHLGHPHPTDNPLQQLLATHTRRDHATPLE
jgi:LmbE family N-acetylglucosaminyl deacetylase